MPSKPYLDSSDRMTYARERKGEPDFDLSEYVVRKLGTKVLGFAVWMLDGPRLRHDKDIDFTSGGNPSRYRYFPDGVVGIDSEATPEDAAADIVHEAVEGTIMRDDGASYDDAHDEANVWEWRIRDGLAKGTLEIGKDPSELAAEVLRDFGKKGSKLRKWAKRS